MWRRSLPRFRQWLISGGYLMLLMVGAQLESRAGWLACTAAVAGLAFFAWRGALHRSRAVADMPTSRIASAAQGYVELYGRGIKDAEPLFSPLTQRLCLWYRYRVERRKGKDWVQESEGESNQGFFIDDGSGRCCIDPVGAEILPADRRTWQEGERRYTESLLTPGEKIYALGAFRTWTGDSQVLDARRDIGALLAEWKQDKPTLLQRFDRNGDGEIDLDEWAAAREAARAEVDRQHREQRAQPDHHLMQRPEDGRLYLISSQPPERIERNFRYWSLAHAAIFLAALAGLAALASRPELF